MASWQRARRLRRAPAVPLGRELTCRGWEQEGALRCLLEQPRPDGRRAPRGPVVYGGAGKAARDWESADALVGALRRLGDDETLLVQSGRPVLVVPLARRTRRVS